MMSCFDFKAIIFCAHVSKNKKTGIPPSQIPHSLPKPHHKLNHLLPSYDKFDLNHTQFTTTNTPFSDKSSPVEKKPDNSFNDDDQTRESTCNKSVIQQPIDTTHHKYIMKSLSSNGRFEVSRAAAAFTASRTMSTKGGDQSMRRRELSGCNNKFMRRSNTSMRNRQSPPVIMFSTSSGVLKPPQVEVRLPCTLDQLCFGCVKQMRVYRDIVTSNGQVISQQEELLTVNVEPGWTHGTRITFQEDNQEELTGDGCSYTSDVVFIVTEKVHDIFRRRDEKEEDLEMEVVVSLVDAITDYELCIPLLSGDCFSLFIDQVITPGFEKVIEGQGMPDKKDPTKRGDLRVKFDVEFPKTLTDQQRDEIRKVLALTETDDSG